MEKLKQFENPINKLETVSEYHSDKIFKELESLTFLLIEKLKENIDKGEYDMLIGDDASGRIPTLVLRGIINARNRELHPELKSSESEIKTRFVAGGHAKNDKELKIVFKKLKLEIKKKSLIVTEYIFSGESMERFSNVLKKLDIPFDIAALRSEIGHKLDKDNSMELFLDTLKGLGEFLGVVALKPEEPEIGRKNIKTPKETKFFYGAGTYDSAEAPLIYKLPELSGVIKNKDSESKPYTIPFIKKSASETERNAVQEKINNARKDINLLVEKTLEKVWGDKNK